MLLAETPMHITDTQTKNVRYIYYINDCQHNKKCYVDNHLCYTDTYWLSNTSVWPKPVTTTLSRAAFTFTGPSPCNILIFGIFKGSIGGKFISGSPEIGILKFVLQWKLSPSSKQDEEIALSLSAYVPLYVFRNWGYERLGGLRT